MKKKVGLVIQGPLMSIGRAGNNLHLSPARLKETGGLISFDCRENIRKIIAEYGHMFDEIVISTWENEVNPGELFEGAKVVTTPDPGGIAQPGHYKDNNKFRQFLSTLRGLDELEKSGIEYAVKTRTDTHLDFALLLNDFFSKLEREKNGRAVYATVATPQTYMLHDLYFAAELRTLKDFCEAILAFDRFEFISSVHREMILKHAYCRYRQQIGVPDWAYFPTYPPSGACKETNRIFEFMFANIYRNLDAEIFKGTTWRGMHYEKDHVVGLLDKSTKHPSYRNVPALISIDWKRYYAFRVQAEMRKPSFVEHVRAILGGLGWHWWGGFKSLVRAMRSRMSAVIG